MFFFSRTRSGEFYDNNPYILVQRSLDCTGSTLCRIATSLLCASLTHIVVLYLISFCSAFTSVSSCMDYACWYDFRLVMPLLCSCSCIKLVVSGMHHAPSWKWCKFCVGGCCFGTRSSHSTNRNAFRRQQPRDLHDAKPRNACWARLRSDLVTKAARPITFGMVLEGYLFPSFLRDHKFIVVGK